MEGDILSFLQKLLELGWPAIVLLIAYILWRAFQDRTNQLISVLTEIGELKASMDMLKPPDDSTPKRFALNIRPRASRPAS